MKILQFVFCAAIFLTAVSTSNHENKVTLASHVNCDGNKFGKCLMEIAESLFSDTVDSNKVRMKRNVLVSGKCVKGQAWLIYRCWPCNVYQIFSCDIQCNLVVEAFTGGQTKTHIKKLRRFSFFGTKKLLGKLAKAVSDDKRTMAITWSFTDLHQKLVLLRHLGKIHNVIAIRRPSCTDWLLSYASILTTIFFGSSVTIVIVMTVTLY